MNEEWLKKKKLQQHEKEVSSWVLRFTQTQGDQEAWLKVHAAYLNSDIWQEKRKLILKRAGPQCEGCRRSGLKPSELEVHHKTYQRIGGNETLEDLEALCYSCHIKADRKRERATEERRRSRYYQSRLDGFGTRLYGQGWDYEKDPDEVEIEFVLYLYKGYCNRNGIRYDPKLDTETDIDFLEFWDDLLNDRL